MIIAAAGWVVQSRAEMNLGAGPDVAVREFAAASGPVDYALDAPGRLVRKAGIYPRRQR
jgi:type I restriction enzyme, R subunit